MQDQDLNSTRRRRLILLAVLTLGIVGGAGADAVVTLRSGNALFANAVATDRVAPPAPVADGSANAEAQAVSVVDACSCVEGAALNEDRSPLTSRRSKTHRTRHAAPMHVDLCAAVAALEQ